MTDAFTISPHSKEFELSPRWVRVYFNKQLIADSKKMMLLRESNHLPLYYFPKEDVRMDYLQPSDHTTHSDLKGEGVFWHVQVGDKIADNAAFTFRNTLGKHHGRRKGEVSVLGNNRSINLLRKETLIMRNQKTVKSISPKALDALREGGQEIELIDVSTPAEFWEVHVDIARNVPIDSPELERIVTSPKKPNQPLYVMCRAGVRGKKVCSQFAGANLVNVEGGTRAWVKSGLSVVRSQHGISLERQVQIVAGTLIFLGSVLGLLLHPYFAVIPALAGAGLVVKGITGSCALGSLLARIPWRRKTDLVVRPNKVQITREMYESKVKRWTRIWPKLRVIPWDG